MKSKLRRYKPKGKGGRRPGGYTVAELRKKSDEELVAIAKVLAVDYEAAGGETRAALGTLIQYIRGLVEERGAAEKLNDVRRLVEERGGDIDVQ